MSEKYIISIDLGGTKILAAAINKDKGIVASAKKPTKLTGNNEDYVKEIADLIETLLSESKIESEQVRAVSLGVPGSVNIDKGTIGIAPNLGIKNFNISEAFKKHIDFPVLLENDVNLAALGSMNSGSAKGMKNVLVVFIGTGIGGGLIFNGDLYRGSDYIAGEIGHIVIEPGGPVCGCGKKGCFEAVASRTAMVRNITDAIKNGKQSELEKYVKKDKKIKSKAIKKAIKADDKVTVKVVKEACEVTGRVLAGLNNLLNLDAIVLGGGVIEANEKFMMPAIQKSFEKHSLKDALKNVKLLPATLGDDAAIYGGLALADEFLDD